MRTILITLLIAVTGIMLTGCRKVVPPGKTVLILKANGQSEIKAQGSYLAYGRDRVYFVDTRLKSYSKDLKILCEDEINMSVSVKWVGSFNVTDETIPVIKAKVPPNAVNEGEITGYELSLDKFYSTAMQDFISNITRSVVRKYKTDNIRDQRENIRNNIKEKVLARIKELKYPVSTSDVLITNLDYPPEVTAKRNKIKQAELQDLENAAIAKSEVASAKRDSEIALERGKAQLVAASADAAANRIRAASLTPEIITIKQIEMLTTLAKGPNNTVIIIPFEALKSGMTESVLQREGMQQLIDNTKKPTSKKK